MSEDKSVQKGLREDELARMELDYHVLQQRAAELQNNFQQLQALLAENDAASRALEALSKNEELLLPLGAGVMARFRVADKAKVFIEVGGRVVVEKSVADAQAVLKEKQEKISKTIASVQDELFAISRSLQAIEEKAAKK